MIVQYKDGQLRGWTAKLLARSSDGKLSFVKVLKPGESNWKTGQKVQVKTELLEEFNGRSA